MIGRAAILLGLALALPAPGRTADLLGEETRTEAALEERIRLIAVHRLEDDADALTADVADLEARDDERRDRGLPPTGLADDVRYLAAGLASTRDARRDALEDVLDAHPDPLVRRLAEFRLEADDAATAERLLADDRHNRRAAVVNDAVRPFGVFTGAALAAAVNPFLLAGSAVDSLVTTAVNLWNYNRLSAPEREALARYAAALEREPRTEDAPEIAHAVRRLGTKRAETLCRQTTDLAGKASEADDVDHALFYARAAGRIDGCAERAEKPLRSANEARARRAAREEAARWPVDDPPRPASPQEAVDYEALLVATAAGDPGQMAEAASRFRERHDDSAFTASAGYALAVARDLAGHRDAAREALAEVARDDDAAAGRSAAALLASPDFDRLGALRAAERRHSRDTARFVLLGGGMDGRTALYGAVHLGTQGVSAAQSLGIFNVIGVLTRAWQAWRKDPVSNQGIIDRGEEVLAREPGSPEVPAVHRRLADAYERAGAYGRAIMHLRAVSDPDTKRITKLEGKLADDLLAQAERGGGNPVLLQGIVRHFGTTDAAAKARTRLAELPADGALTLGRDVLRANPALLAPSALDLDPQLLDGDRENGEIAEGGITLADGELRVQLERPGETEAHDDVRRLAPEAYARGRAAAEDALYARLLTADRRDPETGRFERYIPLYLQGTLGGDGVAVYPGVKMRRYTSPDRALYE